MNTKDDDVLWKGNKYKKRLGSANEGSGKEGKTQANWKLLRSSSE